MPEYLNDLEAKLTEAHIHGIRSFRQQETDGPLTKSFYEKDIQRRFDRLEHAPKKNLETVSLSNYQ